MLQTDIFENICNMHLKIYELDPVHFVFELELALQSFLKATKMKLQLLTSICC